MNNNHYYRPTLTGNKNRRRVQETNFAAILKIHSNKNANLKSSLLFHNPKDNDSQFNLINRSIDVPRFNDRSASKQRVKTEIVKPNIDVQFQNQKIDQTTAYFPKLKERIALSQNKMFYQKAKNDEIEDSPIRDLQKSLDYSSQAQRTRNLTPIQQRTLDVPKYQSRSDHLNQEEIMQFSFGLQYNRQSIEKQKQRFPKDIFLGDVRKVKRIFQQQ
ncbi:unnamed protein product (macronuclear) [Paramecium tetraurelia]|uniref:Uncharacterized protein n=1 Tax=Paramecium tetraurelia TaxID=5888 RepID=A0DFB8_PARTE|nr:uncharacterized protein GSPATT00016548001 [Paramecium tetraurelia]CAK81735.1 unnamed protein product [Paramecium tetraurelia]|eukprot:XP_001449132.1 hypothetical protein (macronuclear) [Paramecium tetraurelia strain d4-2]